MRSARIMKYTLTDEFNFTLNTQEWRMIVMQPGDTVRIVGEDISIQDPETKRWHETIDMVNPVLMSRLQEWSSTE